MAVLALDLASTTGWAVYAEGMDRPHSGSVRIKRPNGSLGEAAARLIKLIAEREAIYGGFSDIVYEAQHLADGINPQTMYLLIGLGFVVEYYAHEIGARVFSCDIGTWRKHFLGVGSFRSKKDAAGKVIQSGRAQAKARVIDVCAAYGWHPTDDNAADALGILEFYLHQLPLAFARNRPWRDAQILAGYRTT